MHSLDAILEFLGLDMRIFRVFLRVALYVAGLREDRWRSEKKQQQQFSRFVLRTSLRHSGEWQAASRLLDARLKPCSPQMQHKSKDKCGGFSTALLTKKREQLRSK
jgi:hypothetical protein